MDNFKTNLTSEVHFRVPINLPDTALAAHTTSIAQPIPVENTFFPHSSWSTFHAFGWCACLPLYDTATPGKKGTCVLYARQYVDSRFQKFKH